MTSRRNLVAGWVLALAVAALFARLGTWQLARMHEKQAMLDAVHATLQAKSPAHGWEVAGHARPNGDGAFNFTYRPGHTGKHVFRVIFPGKNSYLPTSRLWTVRVHR